MEPTWQVLLAVCVTIGVLMLMPRLESFAQIPPPFLNLMTPSSPTELPRAVIRALSRGLAVVGIDLNSYPSLTSALDGLLNLQMVRLDSLGGVTNLGERVNGAVESLLGVDLQRLARLVLGVILGLLDKGIALIEKGV